MSEMIQAGSKRRVSRSKRPESQSIGKRRKIDRTENELELGRFTGKTEADRAAEAKATKRADPGEVVGPKRRKTRKADAEASNSRAELSIAAPLTVDDGDMPNRPRAQRRRRSRAGSGMNGPRMVAFAFLSAILIAATAATFLLMPRYDQIGDALVADPAFESGLEGWEQAGEVTHDPEEPGQVVLESDDPDTRTHLVRDIQLPPGDTLLVLRARVQGEDVVTGPEIWDSARIYLAELDAAGRPRWEKDHNLFKMNGTTEVRNYIRAFSMPETTTTARLAIEMKNASGRLTVTSLELTAVERRPSYVMAAGAVVFTWAALVLYTAFRTFRGIESASIRLWLGAVCALSVIGLMLPGSIHDFGVEQIAERFGITDIGIDSIGHGIMFTALSFLVRLGRPSYPLWIHAGAWGMIAVASEVLQLLTIDRDPSLDDLLVDGLGIFLGLTLAEITRLMRRFSSA